MSPQLTKPTVLNRRVSSLSPSMTLAIDAKAKQLKAQGVDVVNFAGGEPDFDTAQVFKDAAIKALQEGMTRYTPASGTPAIREAIAEKLKRDNGLEYTPDQIVVTVGAKHAVFNALQVVADEGDEVIIPAPYWLSYPEMVRMTGAKFVVVPTTASENFKLTPRALEQAITPSSKVLILNSPSNPAGTVYSKEELTRIVEVAVAHGLIIVSDEIYETLVYGEAKHYAVAGLDRKFYDSVITINGLSKSFAMTGWRLGYLAAPLPIAKAAANLQSHQTSNVTSFIQPAAVVALKSGAAEAKRVRDIFAARSKLIISLLKSIPKMTFPEPQGAFYVFANIKFSGLRSIDFSQKLLEEAHVAVVPGLPFGADDFVRISFATSDEQIKKGVERIRTWLGQRNTK